MAHKQAARVAHSLFAPLASLSIDLVSGQSSRPIRNPRRRPQLDVLPKKGQSGSERFAALGMLRVQMRVRTVATVLEDESARQELRQRTLPRLFRTDDADLQVVLPLGHHLETRPTG